MLLKKRTQHHFALHFNFGPPTWNRKHITASKGCHLQLQSFSPGLITKELGFAHWGIGRITQWKRAQFWLGRRAEQVKELLILTQRGLRIRPTALHWAKGQGAACRGCTKCHLHPRWSQQSCTAVSIGERLQHCTAAGQGDEKVGSIPCSPSVSQGQEVLCALQQMDPAACRGHAERVAVPRGCCSPVGVGPPWCRGSGSSCSPEDTQLDQCLDQCLQPCGKRS